MFLRQHLENPFQLRKEPQVHQPIGLVDHNRLDHFRTDNTIIIYIHETPRRSHEQVHSFEHPILLCPDIRSPVHTHATNVHEFRQQFNTLAHLHHQFPRGNNHQRPRHQPLRIMQFHQHRDQVSQRLSRTGLGNTNQIPPGATDRKYFFLNRSRVLETSLFQRHQNLLTYI